MDILTTDEVTTNFTPESTSPTNTTSKLPVRDDLEHVPEKVNNPPAQTTWDKFRQYTNDGGAGLNRFTTHLIGIDAAETSALMGRFEEDQKILRGKYGLPSRDILEHDPKLYRDKLIALAKAHGVRIRKHYEFSRLFDRPGVGGRYFREGRQLVTNDSTDPTGLEHEIIHGIQAKKFPGMSIEQMEYEAYLAANYNHPDTLQRPQNIYDLISHIQWSVKLWYKDQGEKSPWEKNSQPKASSPNSVTTPPI